MRWSVLSPTGFHVGRQDQAAQNGPRSWPDHCTDVGSEDRRCLTVPNDQAAISYCGLCGDERSSTDKAMRMPLSKQRNKHVQRTLVEAAKLAPRQNHELVVIYDQEKQKGNGNRATLFRSSLRIVSGLQRTQTQSSVKALRSLRQQMDVWFGRAQEPMPRGIFCVLNILDRMTCTLFRACPGSPAERLRWSFTALLICVLQQCAPAEPIPVRRVEGTVHGFLALRSKDGSVLAVGDLFQVVHGDREISRLIFRFKDGSVDDETAVFSQRGHFQLITNHHIQPRHGHFCLRCIWLGGVAGMVAPLIGRQPPDIQIWIIGGQAPAFVKEQGPLYQGGLIWTIQLTSPVWPDLPRSGF